MKVLMISGSSRPNSTNEQLLNTLPARFANHDFEWFKIEQLPLFRDQGDGINYPEEALSWRSTLQGSDLLIICTPEYLHNIPAALKNALEWVSQSGELNHKKVLPITYTPTPPRGGKAMQSLLWSLQALEANIMGQLDLYQNDTTTTSLLHEVLVELLIE